MNRREFLRLAAIASGAAALSCGPIASLTGGDRKLQAKEGLLDTPETGTYSRENLLRWQELEPQPKLDPRIGISILPSKYVRGEGAVEWHTDVATKLGFQRVSIVAAPLEHEDHTGIVTARETTLDELIQRPYFGTVFNHPEILGIHMTCDVAGAGTVNASQLRSQDAFTPSKLEATYQEYRRFAEHLLTRYGTNGKEIVVGGPNELDLLAKGGYDQETEDADISPQAIANAIAYYDTFHRAIRDGNAAHPDKQPLLTGAEVLQIRSLWDRPDARTGLNSVLPHLEVPPDEISLSAWQVAGKGKDGYLLGAAVRLIHQHLPQSRIAISEFGIADGDRPELTQEEVAYQYEAGLQTAWAESASSVTIWGLTDYDAEVVNPNNGETRGLGLIRPDGSIRQEVYSALRRLSGVELA